MKYFIEKVGAYGHGVAWIGEDVEEGKVTCREFAQKDSDDYHRWILYEFSPEQPDYSGDIYHTEVFYCRKET